MPGIWDLEAAAEKAAEANETTLRAYHAGFPYASPEAQEEALARVVPAHVEFERVTCLAVRVGRSSARRGHWRFTWMVDSKRATVDQAAAAIHLKGWDERKRNDMHFKIAGMIAERDIGQVL